VQARPVASRLMLSDSGRMSIVGATLRHRSGGGVRTWCPVRSWHSSGEISGIHKAVGENRRAKPESLSGGVVCMIPGGPLPRFWSGCALESRPLAGVLDAGGLGVADQSQRRHGENSFSSGRHHAARCGGTTRVSRIGERRRERVSGATRIGDSQKALYNCPRTNYFSPSVRARCQQIRMVVPHAGIQLGNHYITAARGCIPRRHRIDPAAESPARTTGR